MAETKNQFTFGSIEEKEFEDVSKKKLKIKLLILSICLIIIGITISVFLYFNRPNYIKAIYDCLVVTKNVSFSMIFLLFVHYLH